MRWWPWSAPQSASRAPAAASEHPPEPPAATLLTRLAELEAQVSHLRSERVQLATEWADTLERITRWASRQAGRERRNAVRALDLDEAAQQEASGDTISHHPEGNGGGDFATVRDRKAELRRRLSHRGGQQ